MAVRLRIQDGTWIALCAAEFGQQSGDIYLDDAQDHALREKYMEDWREEERILLLSDSSRIEVDGEKLEDLVHRFVMYKHSFDNKNYPKEKQVAVNIKEQADDLIAYLQGSE